MSVTLRNTGTKNLDYAIEKNDDTASAPGQIGARTTKTVVVKLREDRRTVVQVTQANKQVETRTLTANCKRSGAAPPSTPPSKLPHTGPDTGLWAKAATGVAAMLTGVIIFWYGGIWPRRREQIFAKKTAD
ncbi:hypothetical protein [Actinomadura fibrosa]|uniref:Uncharacterized protein n=1 Tax=Actinomadura fibrosa TaxID=111802 RepID=A0ABW2XVT7_9ACTN|nr:hypothetical protein [Actinomadura fibrosa]